MSTFTLIGFFKIIAWKTSCFKKRVKNHESIGRENSFLAMFLVYSDLGLGSGQRPGPEIFDPKKISWEPCPEEPENTEMLTREPARNPESRVGSIRPFAEPCPDHGAIYGIYDNLSVSGCENLSKRDSFVC